MHSSISTEGLILALERLNRLIAAEPNLPFSSQDEYEIYKMQDASMRQERTTIRAELLRRGVPTTLTQGLDKVLL